MSDFLDLIKITDEDKKDAMSRILFTVINSTRIMSLDETLQHLKEYKENCDYLKDNKQIEQKLNENEILAVYSLAREVRISIEASTNKRLLEYLELGLASANEENLLRFINETIKDIELSKKINPNIEWRLQVEKIFSRLEGKKSYEEEILKQKIDNSRKGNIIKLSNYSEK